MNYLEKRKKSNNRELLNSKKKKINMLILLILAVTIIIFNLIYHLSSPLLEKKTLREFLKETCGKELNVSCDYNLYIIVSPLDCQECVKNIITEDFIESLKKVSIKKRATLSINYVITGDYSREEKIEFVSRIKNEVEIFIDKKNSAKDYLYAKFKTMRTPFIIILPRIGQIKCWQALEPDENYDYRHLDKKVLNLLEAIL